MSVARWMMDFMLRYCASTDVIKIIRAWKVAKVTLNAAGGVDCAFSAMSVARFPQCPSINFRDGTNNILKA
jgi:hypothetical protein